MPELSTVKKGKTQSIVGLDIGTYAIKCVEVDSEAGKIRLFRVSILPVDPASPESIPKALKHCFDPAMAPARRVRVSVSGGSSLLIRRIQLPAMTHSELKGAIRFEAEGHIPFPVEDCELDFQILNEAPDKKSINVLLVAAKKDLIQERLKLLASVSVVPEVIDVDIFCLINAYQALGENEKDTTFGLLNIGHRVSSFAIIQDKLPYFVREIPFGSKGLTQAIQKAKNVSENTADRLKIERPAEAALDARALALEGFEPLIEEIRHSIDYFENEAGEDLKTIWLSGGGALFPGTAELLSEELGKQFSVWDNTKKMEVFGDVDQKFLVAHAPELNVALGMVLRGGGAHR